MSVLNTNSAPYPRLPGSRRLVSPFVANRLMAFPALGDAISRLFTASGLTASPN
jgi:hypothetical protein